MVLAGRLVIFVQFWLLEAVTGGLSAVCDVMTLAGAVLNLSLPYFLVLPTLGGMALVGMFGAWFCWIM